MMPLLRNDLMRVIVVHSPKSSVRDIRQAVLGAGAECATEDCVVASELAARMAQVDAKLIVLKLDGEQLDAAAIRDVLQLSPTQCVALGDDTEANRSHAEQCGAEEFLPRANLRSGLEALVHQQMTSSGQAPRGAVVTVFAPVPGSGATTTAVNLAGALAAAHPGQTALLELAHSLGDIALLLNISPTHAASDACARWQSLDRDSLESFFHPHEFGVNVLANGGERFDNPHLEREAVRRLGVLTRFLFGYSVLALESRLGDAELEAMRLSDRVIIVVRPDVVSVRRTAWALDACEEHRVSRERVHLVLNRFAQPGQLSLHQIESALGSKIAARIPDDPARVNSAVNRGEFLHQYARRSAIARSFDALAQQMTAVAVA